MDWTSSLNNGSKKSGTYPVANSLRARSTDNEASELKIDLALALIKIIETRKLTVSRAAQIIGTDPTKMCAILHGRLKGMSVERLIRYACLLGNDVNISITHARPGCAGAVKIIERAGAF